MILHPTIVKQIASRRKTQTRRPIKPGEHDCHWETGHCYPIQVGREWTGVRLNARQHIVERSAPTRARSIVRYLDGPIDANYDRAPVLPTTHTITITDIQREQLAAITLEDVKREGFITTAQFFASWEAAYGPGDPNPDVWVISFVYGDHTDTDRFLAAHPGGRGGDYTTSHALAAEPDAPAIPAHVQERYSELGTRAWSQRFVLAQAQRERMELGDRLRELERAQARGLVNVSSELRVIRQRLQKLKAA